MKRQFVGVMLALVAGAAVAAAPAAGTPAIEGVVAAGTPVELLHVGSDGTEGPLPFTDGSFLFTENRAGRILRIAADGTVSVFMAVTNGSNSLALNARNELVSVQTAHPAVGVIYPAGRARTLVDGHDGQPFSRPNDLVVTRRGGIYFTDPGVADAAGTGRTAHGVYYLSPQGALSLLTLDIEFPNGIQLSADERTLYVANTAGEAVLAFDVPTEGVLGARREFAHLAGITRDAAGRVAGGADGLAIDAQGRLYVATGAGVQVFSADGTALGVIPIPRAPQNLAFAGPGKQHLHVVGRGAVYRIRMLTPGFAGRAK